MEYLEEYKYPTMATLNLTDACNLQCKYCFVQQKPNFMTFDIAKTAVDFLVNNYKWREKHNCPPSFHHKKRCGLCFFGGEPLLMFNPIIKPIIEYCETQYPNIFHYSITTNGTLLTNEIINFLKQNHCSIMLSMDGNKDVQDYNRPCIDPTKSSFDLITPHFEMLLNTYPFVTFRSTFFQDTINKMFDSYLFAEKSGFRNYHGMPDHRAIWSKENIKIMKQEIKKIYNYRLNEFLNNIMPIKCGFIDESLKLILIHDIKKIKNLPQNEEIKYKHCGTGINFVSIGYNGDIYGCQEQVSRKETNNFFLIGNLSSGINIEKHKLLLKEYNKFHTTVSSKIDRCSNCFLNSYQICTQNECISCSHDLYSNLNVINEVRCVFEEELIKNSIITMRICTEKNNQIFKKYLSQIGIFNEYFPEWRELDVNPILRYEQDLLL